MGRKRHNCTCGAFDDACLDKVAVNEPIFVLRAQDLYADDVVTWWVDLVRRAATYGGKTMSERLQDKLEEAETVADSMAKWPNRRAPD